CARRALLFLARACAVFSMINRRRLISGLFPYTTLFRSPRAARAGGAALRSGRGRALRRGAGERRAVRAAAPVRARRAGRASGGRDRKSTRLNSSHVKISYAVFCLKKKTKTGTRSKRTTS